MMRASGEEDGEEEFEFLSQSAGQLVWREYDLEAGRMVESAAVVVAATKGTRINPLTFLLSMGMLFACNMVASTVFLGPAGSVVEHM